MNLTHLVNFPFELRVLLTSNILCFCLVFQLHVVHYNSDKYKSFTEARDKPDGLAVLAFIYDVREPQLPLPLGFV